MSICYDYRDYLRRRLLLIPVRLSTTTPTSTTTSTLSISTDQQQQQTHPRPLLDEEPPSQRRRVVNDTTNTSTVRNSHNIASSTMSNPVPGPPTSVFLTLDEENRFWDMIEMQNANVFMVKALKDRVERIFSLDYFIRSGRVDSLISKSNMLTSIVAFLELPGIAASNPDLVEMTRRNLAEMASNIARECLLAELNNNEDEY